MSHTRMQELQRKAYPRVLLQVLLIALFMAGCSVQTSPITGNKRAYGYTWAQEVQIGKEADAQIIQQFGMYDDPELTAYVTRIGEEVLAESHLRRPDAPAEYRNTAFTFRVLDSPVLNAFALPGGYVYVTRGLIAHMENEAQLAMVLGHEVGHVAGRHASQRALSSKLAMGGLIVGAIGGELLGYDGQNILQAGSMGAQLLLLSYGRDDERESDALGVEYSARAGYAAEEGAGFFTTLRRMSEKSGQAIPSFMSTHPDPGEREGTIRELAASYRDTYEMDKKNQDQLFAAIDGIVFGENPRHGFVEDNTFYHPDLRFRFPVPLGWTTINQPSQVTILDDAQNPSAALLLAIESEATSAANAAGQFAGQQGLTVRSNRATSVNGLPAQRVEADATGQNNTTMRVLAYFIEYGGNVYRLMGLANSDRFSAYNQRFEASMGGFKELTDRRILNVEPNRLRVVRSDQSTAFRNVVGTGLPQGLTVEDMAILNQVQVDTPIERGRRLKLVRD